MNTVITIPTLKFYKFYNVPLARRLKEEIEASDLEFIRTNGEGSAYHSDLKRDKLASQAELRQWLQECLDEVTAVDLPKGFQCKVNEVWLTRTDQGQAMHKHSHPFSVYSGVFYLQDSPGATSFACPTWFSEKWPQLVPAYVLDRGGDVKYDSPCKEGHLIIFPSHLFHYQRPYASEETRHTIAWNSFWQGTLSDHRSARLYIDSREFAPGEE